MNNEDVTQTGMLWRAAIHWSHETTLLNMDVVISKPSSIHSRRKSRKESIPNAENDNLSEAQIQVSILVIVRGNAVYGYN